MAQEEERGHRGWGPHFAKIGVTDAARLFVVKRVAEYLTGKSKMPRGKEFLYIQRSCFQCAGLVDAYRKEIRKAWRKFNVAELTTLDYCEGVAT